MLLSFELVHGQVGSLERIPATGTDVARELGIVMRKFKVRFDTPMHCMVTLKIKHVGSEDTLIGRDRSVIPQKTFELLFSMKDDNLVLRHLGLSEQSEVEDAVKFSVMSRGMGFDHYDKNPFGKMRVGQAFYIWSQRNSTEELPLDEEIPIYIKAGPYTTGGVSKVRDITEEYVGAEAFVHLSVVFSEEEIVTPEEAERQLKVDEILEGFDRLVEEQKEKEPRGGGSPGEKVPE
jgi:hypothetical protein